MNDSSVAFLKRLLSVPGPAPDEAAAARIWRDEAGTFADRVWGDVRGNAFAALDGGPLRVLLSGHIDEIGVMVSHIDDDGFLYFSGVGGWDTQVLVGQRIRLKGRNGDVIGVIGKKPIHLMKPADREKVSTIDDLWIDIGVKSKAEATELLRIGTTGVIDAGVYEFPHGRIASRSIDNRIGAYTVLEALRLLAQDRPQATVAAVAAAQEEITLGGAHVAAFSFDPQVAVVVDVTFATDHPGADKRQQGDVKLGGGPVIARGSAGSPVLFDMIVGIAEREQIPHVVQITPRYTGTDADAIHIARGGIATVIVSIPNRYMHSPNEMIAIDDVAHAAKLIAALVRTLNEDTNLIPS
jgi:putative aminopeptidase FrvX